MLKIVFVTNIPAPYKFSRFEALAALDDVDLTVYYANDETSRHRYHPRDSDAYDVCHRRSITLSVGSIEFLVDTWSLREFATIDCDVFVVGGWNYTAAWAAILAGRLRDIPTAMISANVATGNALTRWLIRRGLRRINAFFALSSTAAEDLAALGADSDDISILPNSTDIESFRADLSTETQATIRSEYDIGDRFLVLYVGNLERQKGVDDLVAATAGMVDTCLLIVGEGPERPTLERQAGERVGDSVVFAGWVENTDLANYYAAADVFSLPTYGDTWGLVLNEALSCGTPVVTTTAAGAAGDLVIHEGNGFVVTPGDVAALREALDRLRRDETLREAYAARGTAHVKEYTPQRYAETLLTELQRFL